MNIPMSADLAQKIFVSLHLFEDFNGRSSRLFYRWFHLNRYNSQDRYFRKFVVDSDLTDYKTSTSERSYQNKLILAQMYIMSAHDDATRVERAKMILSLNYVVPEVAYLDMWELLK